MTAARTDGSRLILLFVHAAIHYQKTNEVRFLQAWSITFSARASHARVNGDKDF